MSAKQIEHQQIFDEEKRRKEHENNLKQLLLEDIKITNTIGDNFVDVSTEKEQAREAVSNAIGIEKSISDGRQTGKSENYRQAKLYYLTVIQYYNAGALFCKVNGDKNTKLAKIAYELGGIMNVKANFQKAQADPKDVKTLKTIIHDCDTAAVAVILAILQKEDKEVKDQEQAAELAKEEAQEAQARALKQGGGFGKTIRSRSRKHNKNKKRTSNKKRASKKRS